jgi:phage tail sheath gpL-like
MTVNENSLAPANAVSGQNVPQSIAPSVLKRKLIIIATYDPALTAVVPEVPVRVLSANAVGDQFGFGFMAHRLAIKAFKTAPGAEIYIQPQEEEAAGTQAAGSILIDTAPGVAGSIYVYIAGELVKVNVATDDDEAAIAGLIIAAINADKTLPVTALVNATPEQLDITAKSEGDYYGNAITIDTNIYGETDIGALAYTITAMTSGVGTPDIDDALNALGTGSGQNGDNYTDLVHGYGPVTAVLDKISTYNGIADQKSGNYSELVHRPFRSVNCDTAAGSGGLSALIVIGNGRKTDRSSGIIGVPGSASHPAEIAAQITGYMVTQNNKQAELSYRGFILDGIHTGAVADRWTDDYDSGREAAAQAGISCTLVKSGSVTLQNALTFYHPDSIPVDSNAYRNMRNISILQNIFAAVDLQFSLPKWQQFSVVKDLAKVGNVSSRKTAKSPSSVIDDWMSLFTAFAGRAWIADLNFSVNALKETGAVVIRGAGNGFDVLPKFIFSGDGDIINTNIEYDTSFAILNQ